MGLWGLPLFILVRTERESFLKAAQQIIKNFCTPFSKFLTRPTCPSSIFVTQLRHAMPLQLPVYARAHVRTGWASYIMVKVYKGPQLIHMQPFTALSSHSSKQSFTLELVWLTGSGCPSWCPPQLKIIKSFLTYFQSFLSPWLSLPIWSPNIVRKTSSKYF